MSRSTMSYASPSAIARNARYKSALIDEDVNNKLDFMDTLTSNVIVTLDMLQKNKENRENILRVEESASELGFEYNPRSQTFTKVDEYKTDAESGFMVIPFDRMNVFSKKAELGGISLEEELFGEDLDKGKRFYMSDKELQRHMETVDGDDTSIFSRGDRVRSSEILSSFDYFNKTAHLRDYQEEHYQEETSGIRGALQRIVPGGETGYQGGLSEEEFKTMQPEIYGDLSTVSPETLSTAFDTHFGSQGDFYGAVQSGDIELDKSEKLGYLGRYGDTEIAKVGDQWAHVNTSEARMLAIDPTYANRLASQVPSPTYNPDTGLPEYFLGDLGQMAMTGASIAGPAAEGGTFLGMGAGTLGTLGMLGMAGGMVMKGIMGSQAAREKGKILGQQIGNLRGALEDVGVEKTEGIADIHEQRDVAMQSLSEQAEQGYEDLGKSAQSVIRRGKGLKTGQAESVVAEGKEALSSKIESQESGILEQADQQIEGMAAQSDQQMADIMLNLDQLEADYKQNKKKRTFLGAMMG